MDLLNRDFLSGKESSRGKKFTCWGKRNIDSLLVCSFAVHLRVLCSLGHLAHVSSQMLLASTGNFSSYPFFVYGIILAPVGTLQNPDIVLVHYLNVPYPDDNKLVIASSVTLWGEKKEWTKEELISQLKPMCKVFSSSLIECIRPLGSLA